MKIVIDAHLAVKQIDGIARYLNGLLLELPVIDKSIQYIILTLPHNKSSLPGEIFSYPNVKKIEFNINGPSPKQHFVTGRILKKIGADVYHHPQYDLPYGINIPTVVTIHDLKYIFHANFLKKQGLLKSIYIRHILKRTLKAAEQVIAISQSTLNDINKLISIDQKKVKVIFHGVDYPLFLNEVDEKKIIKDFKISDNFILFVGTRRPHKNISGLVRALAILRNQYKHDINLVVCGKSYSDYREPELLMRELNLENHVHFLDFVSDEKLPVLYKTAKIFALVSFYEGFGLPILEAMSYGKPVIGSNVSSIPEVIGGAGLLVNPNDAEEIAINIDRILNDSEFANSLSQASLARSREFTWEKVAESTLNLYIKAYEKSNSSFVN